MMKIPASLDGHIESGLSTSLPWAGGGDGFSLRDQFHHIAGQESVDVAKRLRGALMCSVSGMPPRRCSILSRTSPQAFSADDHCASSIVQRLLLSVHRCGSGSLHPDGRRSTRGGSLDLEMENCNLPIADCLLTTRKNTAVVN
jgi:hypothetical protein